MFLEVLFFELIKKIFAKYRRKLNESYNFNKKKSLKKTNIYNTTVIRLEIIKQIFI